MNAAAAEYVHPSALVPWADNPRANSDAVEPVMESIRRFGFATPIVARREDNMVIAGHTRLAASLRMGLEQVPVRFLDITETEAKALALADNKLGELAAWDDPTLSRILSDLNASAVDLEGLGFDEEALASLIQQGQSVFDLGLDDDDDDGNFANGSQFTDATGVSFVLSGAAELASDPTVKAAVVAFAEEHGLALKVQVT